MTTKVINGIPTITGSNPKFVACFYPNVQYYLVYKNNVVVAKAFKFSDIASYLN